MANCYNLARTIQYIFMNSEHDVVGQNSVVLSLMSCFFAESCVIYVCFNNVR